MVSAARETRLIRIAATVRRFLLADKRSFIWIEMSLTGAVTSSTPKRAFDAAARPF
jgi:hypothetical protein